MYGATKLASELLIEEYRAMYGLRTVVNRCGVIAGPGRWARSIRGSSCCGRRGTLFGEPLSYTGSAARGTQVRDVLHVADLYDLVRVQIEDMDEHVRRTSTTSAAATPTASRSPS